MQTAVLILLLHFIGDFALQSSKMAVNKATSLRWLSIHVAVYTSVLLAGMLLLLGPHVTTLYYVLANGALHWVTDYFTSRLNARFYAANQLRFYYCGIGADQLIHHTCLLLSYDLLVG